MDAVIYADSRSQTISMGTPKFMKSLIGDIRKINHMFGFRD